MWWFGMAVALAGPPSGELDGRPSGSSASDAFTPVTLVVGKGVEQVQIDVAAPNGWPMKVDRQVQPLFSRPDGITTFGVTLTCAGLCAAKFYEINAAELGASQASLWTKLGADRSEVLRSESSGPGRWTILWRMGFPGQPEEIHLQVLHWEASWSRMVSCEFTTTSEAKALLMAAEQACLGLTRR